MPERADKFLPVAKVIKSFRSNGEFLIRYTVQDQKVEIKGPVFIFIDGLPVPFFVENFTWRGEDQAVVKLEEAGQVADRITGEYIYTAKNQKDESSADLKDDFRELEGFSVLTPERTLVGTVSAVYLFPGNPCLGILKAEEKTKEVLIPLHKNFIVSIKIKRREIIANIPAGLLDL
jgi:16S rRNA processing protein RimM